MTTVQPSMAADNYGKEQQIMHVENGHQSDDERKSVEDDPLTYFTPAEQKKIIHRLDRRLVTVVGVMYCVSLMDRSNLSNAAIAGMNAELELTVGMRYVSDTKRLDAVSWNMRADIDMWLPVHRHPGLLHHLHRLPTTGNCSHTQDRAAQLPRWTLYFLGSCYDWNGFHE
jgi:hypothetical protein